MRDQKDRATCLAFALSAAHAKHHSQADWLSVEYLFYHALQLMIDRDPSNGLTFAAGSDALRDEGQPEESSWPYQANVVLPLPKPPDGIKPIWRANSRWVMNQDIAAVVSELENQRLVILGVQVSSAFFRPPTNPCLIDDVTPGFGGHAVLAVGIGTTPEGTRCVLIQNSWGSAWGDGGFAWLSTNFLAKNLIGYMWIA